jgi:amidohydrolase
MPLTETPSVPTLPSQEALGSLDQLPDGFDDVLRSLRRHLHRNPEVGTEEHETARFIRAVLEAHGLSPHGPIAGTGQFVDIGDPARGPHVGYRADIDALPAEDAKQRPYASQNAGAAHLCGHDAHTAVAIGVTLLLSRLQDALPGAVRVFFQPNEESLPSGAPLMIRDGVLENLEAAYAIHVDPTREVGAYGLKAGSVTASADRFNVRIFGKSTGHSARPHDTADTPWIAVQIANAFYQLAGRMTDPRNAAIVTICRMEGGAAHNVIPREALLGGTLRCIHADDRKTLKAQMTEVAHQTALRCGAQAEVEFSDGPPPVHNDRRLVSNVRLAVREEHPGLKTNSIKRPSMGAEDFAFYGQHLPAVLVRAGTGSRSETRRPLHDAHFDIDERALAPTAQLMATVLMRHLRERVLDEAK